MTTEKKPWCCEPKCELDAKWEIWWGNAPDDGTHACDEHVGGLLESDAENRVYSIAA